MCKIKIRQSRKEFEDYVAKVVIVNYKTFKKIRRRNPARALVRPLNDQDEKGTLGDEKL